MKELSKEDAKLIDGVLKRLTWRPYDHSRRCSLETIAEMRAILGRSYVSNCECVKYEDAKDKYVQGHENYHWNLEMGEYAREASCPFKWYERQKLLVVNVSFVRAVWMIGTDEPLGIENLERASYVVGRFAFPQLKEVRLSFSQNFWTPPKSWG
jgi:hypothetical protein